jgi:hypothetical protein
VRVKPRASAALAVAAAILAAGAAICGYARSELADPRAFSARATAALDDEDVRLVLSEQAVGRVVQAVSPDLLAVRPLLVPAVATVMDGAAFRRAFRAALAARHDRLMNGRGGFALALERGSRLLVAGIRAVSPRLAATLPAGFEPRLVDLPPRSFEVTTAHVIADAASWWWPLLTAALVAALACALLAGGPRNALMSVGVAVALAGLLVVTLVIGFGEMFVSHATDATSLDADHERAAFRALWSALFADLRSAALFGALGGAIVATLASGVSARGLRQLGERRAATLARSPAPGARLARAAVLVALGTGLLLAPAELGRALLAACGAMLVLIGVSELAGRAGHRVEMGADPVRASRLLLGGAAVVLALTVIAIMLVLPAPRAVSVDALVAPRLGCNGARALCGRRLNDVAFPATHNSYAAGDEAGWLFANQRHGIARQLDDGIRGLLIDIHPGVEDPASGRVRTDLGYEGSSRNKVVRELGPEAVRAAEKLTGRIGRGNLPGPRNVYLCHTLCELGSEPLDEQLGIIRRFLDTHPGEVVVLFIEPYVSVEAIEDAMRAAGLLSQAAELRRDQPLPTLGSLVREGTRLVVLAERDGGSRPWYLPGFSFAQDTPYDATDAATLSCRRYRGTPDSPLFLVNHWIASFPPSVSRNGRIGGEVLRERLRRCRRERGLVPNLPAVDFYERSGVIALAERLNSRP